MAKTLVRQKLAPPWEPYSFTIAEAQAAKALARGEATPDQQKLFLKVLIDRICMTYEDSYHPDSERDTTLALGKRNAGLQVVGMINVDLSKLRENNG